MSFRTSEFQCFPSMSSQPSASLSFPSSEVTSRFLNFPLISKVRLMGGN